MKITKLEKKTSSRFTMYVDDEYYYIFDVEILDEFGAKEGLEIELKTLEQMKEKAQYRKARERAYYLISYRDHSEKELFDKLCKSVDEQIASYTVAKMIDLKLIDDEEYAKKLAHCYLNQKKWSQRKSLFELMRKGIDKSLAQSVIDELEIDPVEQIYELIEKKYYKNISSDYKTTQKSVNALARLGYNYSDIKSAISLYKENELIEENEEDNQWQYE